MLMMIFHFFYDFERKVRERRAKDARKTYPLEPCPAQEATYHNDILVASIHSCGQQLIY